MYHRNDSRTSTSSSAVAPAEKRSAAEIIADAMPGFIASDTAQQRRLQQALIDCRAGGADIPQEQKLCATFQLYDEELLTRGDICSLFGIDVRQFIGYVASFTPIVLRILTPGS